MQVLEIFRRRIHLYCLKNPCLQLRPGWRLTRASLLVASSPRWSLWLSSLVGSPRWSLLLSSLVGRWILFASKVFVINHEIVRLRGVLGQVEVFPQEAKKFGRRPVVGILVRSQIFVFHHELKDAKPDTLPLQALMHVEVEDAPRAYLLHGASRYVQRLHASLEKCQGLRIHHNHEQMLASLRVNQLTVRCDRGAEALSFRAGITHGINNLRDLPARITDIVSLD